MSKIDFDQNNEEYFDVLREIGNVGASNASAALAQLPELLFPKDGASGEHKEPDPTGSAPDHIT